MSANIVWDILDDPPELPPCRIWFHAAANTDMAFCNMYPDQAQAINALSLADVLHAAERSGCKIFVLISTLGVYGNPKHFPTNEMHPKLPIEAYAESKAMAEDILLNFQSKHIQKCIIVRPFNTFGPGQNLSLLIPSLIREAVLSHTVKVRNLDSSRDFIYVDDVVRGMYACADKASDGDIINLGSGVETSIVKLIETLGVALGKKLNVEVANASSSYPQVQRSQADTKKARSILEWHPRVSLLEGLRLTIDANDASPQRV